MKKQQDVKDPIVNAEAVLHRSQEAVAANRSVCATLTEEAKRLWAEIGKDGDGSHAERKANRHSVCKARVDRLDQELPALAAKVAEAEAALDLARKQDAQVQIDEIHARLKAKNRQAVAAWRSLCALVRGAAADRQEANDVARAHDLRTPPVRRWGQDKDDPLDLLYRDDLFGQAPEDIRNVIDLARGDGTPRRPPRIEGS